MEEQRAYKPINLPHKTKRVTKKMVEDAIANTKSNAQAARWCGIAYSTYRRWSKYYGLWDEHCNRGGKGLEKRNTHNWKLKLEDILTGKEKNRYSHKQLKKRLIEDGYFKEECSVCGWRGVRATDNKMCIRLFFMDGDNKNGTYENIKILCPNCYWEHHGWFFGSGYFCADKHTPPVKEQ